MSDCVERGKLTNLSLFSAEPKEAEEKASGTKAENKKFIVKRQQKDLPVHNSNNVDNGGKKKLGKGGGVEELHRKDSAIIGGPLSQGTSVGGVYRQRVTHFCF